MKVVGTNGKNKMHHVQCVEQNKIKTGHKVVLAGFGVGLSYGSILMEF